MAVISTLAEPATFSLSHFRSVAAGVGLAVSALLLAKGFRWLRPVFGWRPVVTCWAVPEDPFTFGNETELASFPGLSRAGSPVHIVLSVRREPHAKLRADGSAFHTNEREQPNPNAETVSEMFRRYAKEAGVSCHDPNMYSKGTCIARRRFRRWCLGLCEKSNGKPPPRKCWAHCFHYCLSGQEIGEKPVMVQILERDQSPTPNQQEEIAMARQLGVEIFIATSILKGGAVQFVLFKACEQTDTSCVVDPTSLQSDWLSAVEKGSLQMAELLLNNEGDINVRDSSGRTPLFLAATNGSSEMVQFLINAGADKEALDDSGFSPLHIAAKRGQTEVVKLLLESGSDKNKVFDGNGYTAMHFAALHGHEEIVRLLLDSGADPNILSQMGVDPLYAAAMEEVKKHQDHQGRNLVVVQMLLEAGLEVEGTLKSAAEGLGVDKEVACFLREAKEKKHSAEASERCASSGPAFFHDINRKHLHDGCRVILYGLKNKVELNGQHGEVIGTKQHESKPRLQVQLLKSKKCVLVQPKNVVRWFGPEEERRQNYSRPPTLFQEVQEEAWDLFFSEAQKNTGDTVKSLLEDFFAMGTSQVDGPNSDGKWPAHLAAESGKASVLEKLRAWNYTLDARDSGGRTPAHLAAAAGHVEVIATLHQFGYRLDAEDKDGRTPADLAAAAGHVEVLATFDELGYGRDGN